MAMNFELKEEQQKKLAPLFAQLLQAFQTMKWVRNYNRKNASDGPCHSMSFGMEASDSIPLPTTRNTLICFNY